MYVIFVATMPAVSETKKYRTVVAVHYMPGALVDKPISDTHYSVTEIVPHKTRNASATCTANAPVGP